MKTKITLCSAFFFAFFLVPALVSAATEVSGTTASDMVWMKAGSPYVIGESFVVPSGGIIVKSRKLRGK